ncbi:MAG: hypothetical protein A2579_00585 [Lysobacterales bacterium RIFOXYD1_FULL_69_11]|nr:MAG: hypothetical protein A2190_00650 [Xanthomonadales bacterium RIFOXYA1_FULL_69_10]OHE86380.1 MAG: hypothetical protein A2579_00585 [Xanthomonadales bacterium RIFOXYD1_FULL_69_11]
MAYAGFVTPGGRLLRRSSDPKNLPFLFAAQFVLSHVGWSLAYPLAGTLRARYDMQVALAGVALMGLLTAWRAWPADDPQALAHDHDDLPSAHPHLRQHDTAGNRHTHAYAIDDLHEHWPRQTCDHPERTALGAVNS